MRISGPTRFFDPLLDENPVTVQILGICSALAVSSNLETALTMALAVIAVMAVSSVLISLLRNHIPDSIRLIIQIIIIATFVIIIDLILQAWFFSISQRLSIFVSLIVTNCLVFGRTESFALYNPPFVSFVDALGNGCGYAVVLLIIAGFPAALIGLFFTGSLLIEIVFSLEGLGLLGFEAITQRDYPLIFSTLYMFTLLGLTLGLVSDIMYTIIDPRIDFESR
jgi:Na+-transporting NADH:ubiquinone oxidoreductase subunit D